MTRFEVTIDVTAAAGLGETAAVAVTVHIPKPELLDSSTVVCFAKPGAGFSRGYYSADLPGQGPGSQGDWHADRGWIFISVDHVGVGGSSIHHDPHRLGYTTVVSANHAAEQALLERLADGTLHKSLPPVPSPVVLGIGQSMGGSLTVAQQGRHHCYDGIGVLGFSAVHTHPVGPPGSTPLVRPWRLRDTGPGEEPVILNQAQVEAAQAGPPPDMAACNNWLFFHDDVDPRQFVEGPWISATYPMGVVVACLTPGVIASEAAAVTVPVLIALGQRDAVADPKGEPRAYLSAASTDLFVCPRMGHMHNFASTRELFWRRIDTWGAWVVSHAATSAMA